MSDKLKQAVQQLAGTHQKDWVQIIPCTVDSVDDQAMTCDCTPIGGDADTSLPSVKLNASNTDGFVTTPTVDSVVLVGITSRGVAYVCMFSEVESIQFLDGSLGGLIKIDNLKTQWDSNVTAIKAACSAGFTALSYLDGGASLAAFNASASTILNLSKTPLENTKFTHGI